VQLAAIVGDAQKDTAETHARSIEMAAATHAKGQQDAAATLAKAQLEVASMRFESQKLSNEVAQERLQHDIAVSARELKLKEQQVEFEQVLKLASGFTDVSFDEAVKKATKLLQEMKAST
jgi:FtsZ-binding cell division protein ZapB